MTAITLRTCVRLTKDVRRRTDTMLRAGVRLRTGVSLKKDVRGRTDVRLRTGEGLGQVKAWDRDNVYDRGKALDR